MLRLHLFFHTALLFFASQALALVVTDQLRSLVFPTVTAMADGKAIVYFLFVFFAATLFMLILFQVYKGQFAYRLLFSLAAGVGMLKVFELVFPFSLALVMTGVFLLGLYLVPLVWAHDIIVVVAAAGIGSVFGIQFSIPSAIIVLLLLSVYDFIAVFFTRHMVTLAHEMIRHQASFALIVPERYADFRTALSQIRPGSGFLLLGGGDVVLPMLFSASVYVQDPLLAWWAVAGMLVGVFLNHMWLVERRHPLPALPFIACASILFFAIGFGIRVITTS